MSLFDSTKYDEIIKRIHKLTPENKAAWGKMNVNQMICHCTDGLKMSINELQTEDKSNFFSRTFIKPLVLYVISIPKEVPTAKELDQMKDGTNPTNFASDHKELVASLEKMKSLPTDFTWATHPTFGKLNRKEWGILGYKHLDHHLKQFGV